MFPKEHAFPALKRFLLRAERPHEGGLEMEMAAAPENPVIRCRPGGAYKGLACVLGLVALLFLVGFGFALQSSPPRTPSDLAAAVFCFAFVGGVFVLPAGLLIRYLARAEIVADPQGLRWRGLSKSQTMAWEEISDYYAQTVTTSKSVSTLYVVLAGKRRLVLNPAAWTHVLELRDYVPQRATQAKAAGWGEWQERAADLPQTFEYDVRRYRHAPRLLTQWHALTVTAVVLFFVYRWVTAHTLPGWGWLLTPTGLFLIAKEVTLLVLHPISAETRRRMEQRVTVTADGVIFEDGARRVAAPWDEVTSLYTTGFVVPCYVVETARGDFDFLVTMRDSLRLQKLLLRFAVRVGGTEWRARAGVSSRRREDGAKVYTYRSSRAVEPMAGPFLFSILALVLIGGTVGVTWTSGGTLSSVERDALAVAVVLVLGWLWIIWRHHAAWVRTDERGITQATVFGQRFVPWEQVQEFRWSGSRDLAFGNIIGTYTRLRFWAGLADADALVEEIMARAVNVRSRMFEAEGNPSR